MPLTLAPTNQFVVVSKSFVTLSAHTGTTNETALWTWTMPAGFLGANGGLRIRGYFSAVTSSANTKTVRVRFGGLGGTVVATPLAGTTGTTYSFQAEIFNRNSVSTQIGLGVSNRSDLLQSQVNTASAAVNTAVAQDVTITIQLASSGETITPEGYIIEALRSA